MPLIDWLCCRCCQYPGCCCPRSLRFNRIAADILVCANCCPCMVCCRVPTEKTVFLAGLSGSGKTTLLYYFMLGKTYTTAEPTKGFNSELCTFNKWQTYEFWDPGGSAAQRPLWKKYYSRINFDQVVYCIEANKWVHADVLKKETVLEEDRMELHTLLNEEELASAQFTVWLYYKHPENLAQDERGPDKEMEKALQEVTEDLDLQQYGDRVRVVYQHRDLRARLQVEEDPAKSRGCLST